MFQKRKEIFSIRKTLLGVGSVLLGTMLFLSNPTTAQADEVEKQFNDVVLTVETVAENQNANDVNLSNVEENASIYIVEEDDLNSDGLNNTDYTNFIKVTPTAEDLTKGYAYISEKYSSNVNEAKRLTSDEIEAQGGFNNNDIIITGTKKELKSPTINNFSETHMEKLDTYKLPYIYYPEKSITWNPKENESLTYEDFSDKLNIEPENLVTNNVNVTEVNDVVHMTSPSDMSSKISVDSFDFTVNIDGETFNKQGNSYVSNRNFSIKKVYEHEKGKLEVNYQFYYNSESKQVEYNGKSTILIPKNDLTHVYNVGLAEKTNDGRIATHLTRVLAVGQDHSSVNKSYRRSMGSVDDNEEFSNVDVYNTFINWGDLLLARHGKYSLVDNLSWDRKTPSYSEKTGYDDKYGGRDGYDTYVTVVWKDGKDPKPLKPGESEVKEYKLILKTDDYSAGYEAFEGWKTVTFVGDTKQYDKADDFTELNAKEIDSFVGSAFKEEFPDNFKNNDTDNSYDVTLINDLSKPPKNNNYDVDGSYREFYEDRKRVNFETNSDNLVGHDGVSWDLVPSYFDYGGDTFGGASNVEYHVSFAYAFETDDKPSTVNVYRVRKEENGSVVVAYENESGEVIKNEETLIDNQPVGTQYTSEPTDTIVGTNGQTYYKVKLKDGSQPATGDVTKETKKVTWVYRLPEVTEVKGNVVVKYVDTDGRELLSDYATDEAVVTTIVNRFTAEGGKQLVSSTPSNEIYDVEEQKHPKITEQNIVYNFKEIQDAKPLTGTLTEGETVITLVYEKTPTETREEMGHVKVVYTDENGREIDTAVVKPDEAVNRIVEQPMVDGTKTLVSTTPTNATYDVTADKKERIEFDGKVYKFKQVKDTQPTGTLAVGETVVTYVYEVVTGDVEVKYVDTDNREIKGKITTHNDAPIKSDYDVNDLKDNEIEFDGEVYRYTRTDGNPTGKVTEDTTTVSYVYDVVKGDVEVKYVDVDGREIKNKVITHDDAPIKSDYDVSDRKEDEIEFDGKVYRYTRTDGNPTGKVTEETTTVTHVYDVVKGNVEVKYVDTEGREIKDKVVTHNDVPIKSDYDVNSKKDNEIEHDGKVYRYTRTDGNPIGKVTEETTTVTYVYEVVNGGVEVKYIDIDGNEIKDAVVTHTDVPIKSDYDVNDHKENEIEFNGKVYRYVRTDGNPTGKVTEETTKVTYVYDVVRGDVEVKYVDVDGNEIKDKVVTHDDAPIKSDYDVNTQKENEIEFNGKVYRYTRTDGNPTGKITEETTTVSYVYEVVNGSVAVEYVDVDGNTIKDRVVTHDNAPVNLKYDVSSQKEDEIETTDAIYRYVRTDGNETGNVTEDLTTIKYVYDKLTSSVEVKYVDVEGNELKDTETLENLIVKSDYNVSDRELPEITKKDKTYRLVRVDGDKTGKVVRDKTTITYVFAEVIKSVEPEQPIEEKVGDVEVRYVGLDGVDLKDKLTHINGGKVDSSYDVSTLKDNEIEVNGVVYRYSSVDGEVSGTVKEGTTTITYVYEIVKGSVDVKFVDVDGRELKATKTTHDSVPIKSDYDVSVERESMMSVDGKEYRLVRVDGEIAGKVIEGKTVVTFVYEEVVPELPTEEPEVPKKSKVPTDYPTVELPEGEIPRESKVPSDYPTIEKPEGEIPRESKVPSDYPTVELPEGEIPKESKVPTDYPTVELPEGKVPVTPEVPVTPDKPQKSEVPTPPKKPVQTTPVVEQNGKQLPKTGSVSSIKSTILGIMSLLTGAGLIKTSKSKKDEE